MINEVITIYVRNKKLKNFYDSNLWRKTRAYVRKRDSGICQECGSVGTEVHHIIPLTTANVDNPQISINDKNLVLLCRSCHNSQRSKDASIRADLMFDAQGNIIKK